MSKTKTPWVIKPAQKPHGNEKSMDCVILDGENEIIAECFEKVGRTSEGLFLTRPSVPNAAFIVTCVNAHDALVGALQHIERDCQALSRDESCSTGERRAWHAVEVMAKSALAKVQP